MSNFKKEVSIIGSGISGISCALMLMNIGYKVKIYTRDEPNSKTLSPTYVSLYPAASVIPHLIAHPDINSISSNSNSFYKKLLDDSFPGLVTHTHFELYAHDEPEPFYKNELVDFSYLNEHELTQFPIPNHPNITLKSGWKFNCYFTDWEIYFVALIEKFKELGGTFIQKHITHEDLKSFSSDIIINCAEIGGPSLAGEELDPIFYRGHILVIKDTPPLTGTDGKTISYNFTPPLDMYKSEQGNKQDLYFYPRSSGWVIGGSRQKGVLTESNDWIGEQVIEPSILVGDQRMPAQIETIHQEILEHTYGIDLAKYQDRTLKVGYRYMGNKEMGLRLDSEEKFNKLIVHNYGHGGAGVTLSWGCAYQVANLISKNIEGIELDLEEAVASLNI